MCCVSQTNWLDVFIINANGTIFLFFRNANVSTVAVYTYHRHSAEICWKFYKTKKKRIFFYWNPFFTEFSPMFKHFWIATTINSNEKWINIDSSWRICNWNRSKYWKMDYIYRHQFKVFCFQRTNLLSFAQSASITRSKTVIKLTVALKRARSMWLMY